DLEPPLAQRLEHVAVYGPAYEGLAAHELPVDLCTVPRQRVALIPAPLLRPQAGLVGASRSLQGGRSRPLSHRGRVAAVAQAATLAARLRGGFLVAPEPRLTVGARISARNWP